MRLVPSHRSPSRERTIERRLGWPCGPRSMASCPPEAEGDRVADLLVAPIPGLSGAEATRFNKET